MTKGSQVSRMLTLLSQALSVVRDNQEIPLLLPESVAGVPGKPECQATYSRRLQHRARYGAPAGQFVCCYLGKGVFGLVWFPIVLVF